MMIRGTTFPGRSLPSTGYSIELFSPFGTVECDLIFCQKYRITICKNNAIKKCMSTANVMKSYEPEVIALMSCANHANCALL